MRRRTDSLSLNWDKAAWQQEWYHLSQAAVSSQTETNDHYLEVIRKSLHQNISIPLTGTLNPSSYWEWSSFRPDFRAYLRKVRRYKGRVEEVKGTTVVVKVHSPGDSDVWDACIDLEHFSGQTPQKGDKFECLVLINGHTTTINAKILPRTSRRSLEELGISKEEFLKQISSDV